MKKLSKLLVASVLLLGMLVTVVGCGGETADTPDNQANQVKTLVVGTNASFAPFEFIENNEKLGFDMDLIRAIGEVQGYEVEIQHMDFKALIPALQTSKIDCAIAGMSITPERLESVDFSEAYFNSGLIIAVQEDNEDIAGLADLKGKKLAAQIGTIGAGACDDVKAEDSSTEVKFFDDVTVAFMELEKGGVDAVINDQAVTLNYLQTTDNSKVKTVGEVFQADDEYGIAAKKGNTEMLTVINEGLAKLQENGEFQKIYDKWIAQ
ncbi:MAG: basic amino acid ABC transporter substrate-binding protein [Bacillota bacterium]|nr:basic amino acid ABC transporter substrate-binding protein [Bacillota bacterium]